MKVPVNLLFCYCWWEGEHCNFSISVKYHNISESWFLSFLLFFINAVPHTDISCFIFLFQKAHLGSGRILSFLQNVHERGHRVANFSCFHQFPAVFYQKLHFHKSTKNKLKTPSSLGNHIRAQTTMRLWLFWSTCSVKLQPLVRDQWVRYLNRSANGEKGLNRRFF